LYQDGTKWVCTARDVPGTKTFGRNGKKYIKCGQEKTPGRHVFCNLLYRLFLRTFLAWHSLPSVFAFFYSLANKLTYLCLHYSFYVTFSYPWVSPFLFNLQINKLVNLRSNPSHRHCVCLCVCVWWVRSNTHTHHNTHTHKHTHTLLSSRRYCDKSS
jgi:hypothetical protein